MRKRKAKKNKSKKSEISFLFTSMTFLVLITVIILFQSFLSKAIAVLEYENEKLNNDIKQMELDIVGLEREYVETFEENRFIIAKNFYRHNNFFEKPLITDFIKLNKRN